jgi:hypothetical protein
MAEYNAYILHDRAGEFNTPLRCRRGHRLIRLMPIDV